MVFRSLIITLTLFTLYSVTFSWPSGAPEGACESLTPSHGSNRAKHYSTSPFTLTQSYSDFQPGEKVKGKS